ncbi:MAG: type II toxin-antitoxin system VapB family antitoxin [Micrococcales bacterium]|nr:type II toxin-antitoxin system VapB family antitoxin [Micrococcales bacterium]
MIVIMSITRTTISIDAGLLATARRIAGERNRTLGQLVTEALQRHIVANAPSTPQRVVLPTAGMGGVRSGINLNSNAEMSAMLDSAMLDEEDGTPWSSRM